MLHCVEYLNSPMGLRGEDLASSASLDSKLLFWTSLFYFNTLKHVLQLCLSVFLLALIWIIFQSSNYEVYNSEV